VSASEAIAAGDFFRSVVFRAEGDTRLPPVSISSGFRRGTVPTTPGPKPGVSAGLKVHFAGQ